MKACSAWALRLGMCAAVLGLARAGQAQTITTFAGPNATLTMPLAIDAFGRVVGYYEDTSRVLHGFVRDAQGTFTTVDAPFGSDETLGSALNLSGQIVGFTLGDAGGRFVEHGFLRQFDGSFSFFDAAANAVETRPKVINLAGLIAGDYQDIDFKPHGFLRLPNGSITTFDVPSAGSIAGITFIDPLGQIYGSYSTGGVLHGFVRHFDGTLISFDSPDVSTETGGIGCGHCGGTLATGANAIGRIVGYFGGANHIVHGFLRRPSGAMTTIDVPGAPDTRPAAINLLGEVAGAYRDASQVPHAFLLEPNGSIHSFDVAGANNTQVTAMNLEGRVVGFYTDDSNGPRGFVRTKW